MILHSSALAVAPEEHLFLSKVLLMENPLAMKKNPYHTHAHTHIQIDEYTKFLHAGTTSVIINHPEPNLNPNIPR